MTRLNAIRLTESLKRRLVDFCVSHNHLREPKLQEICRELWDSSPEKGGLASELWVEGSIPYKSSGKSLFDLVAEGRFSRKLAKHLEQRGVFSREMLLHWHQWRAIESSIEKKNPAIVVSAGTGAGKTESFLLPILNDLFESPRVEGTGCRAIIMYPMNALVNDQVDRLYHWLKGQANVTLCHFTSETPEKAGKNVPSFDPCRFRTRNHARGIETALGKKTTGGPVPDILITNYSMLEYMLCRPQDSVFFGPGLRAVVLDEAHLYTSTLAAEITLLLRRLYDKCGTTAENVCQFATSATIGSGAVGELEQFASELFSKEIEDVVAIKGEHAASVLPEPQAPGKAIEPHHLLADGWEQETIVMNKDGKEELAKNPAGCQQLAALLKGLVDPSIVEEYYARSADLPARLLMCLRYSPKVAHLEALLRRPKQKQSPLKSLADELWDTGLQTEKERATTSLLNLCAAARHDLRDAPLIPHRLHFMLRPPDMVTVCCNPDCEDSDFEGLGKVFPNRRERCDSCGSLCLPLYRCQCCGESFLAADSEAGELTSPLDRDADMYFSLKGGEERVIDYREGRLTGSGADGLACGRCDACPNCGTDKDAFRSTSSMTNIVLSILAETMLAELPELVVKGEDGNKILPSLGRRLLAFSDSRSEAARLGPRLRYQHEIQLVRAAIVQMFNDTPSVNPEVINFLRKSIDDKERELAEGLIPDALRQMEMEALNTKKAQLTTISTGDSVSTWTEKLKKRPQLNQLLHDETGEWHQADSWSQSQWESNCRHVREEALFLLGRELFRLPRRSVLSVETAGCVEVVYPGIDSLTPPGVLLGILPEPATRKTLKQCWPDLVAALCDTIRYDSAVTLGSDRMDALWNDDNNVPGKWLAEAQFVGAKATQRRRKFVTQVLRAAGVEDPEDFAEQLLRCVWSQLTERAREFAMGQRQPVQAGQWSWLECDTRQQRDGSMRRAIRFLFPDLVLRKPPALFVSSKTGHVWPRNVLGCAPDPGADGCLQPISEAELDQTPVVGRLRRDFKSGSRVFELGLWAEEHSAQLSAAEARRRQELFRCGIRNLLSATTTLELGIDIGGLVGTFLGNVPPGLANYLQRAGRVGRRSDGSSIVVTCARERPYDREVFRRIGDFLRKPLKRPLVLMGRRRIAARHFHAWLMGKFFEQLYFPDTHVGAMKAFGNMGVFNGLALPEKWVNTNTRKPALPEPLPPLDGDFKRPEWWKDCPPYGLVVPFRRWMSHIEDNVDHYAPLFSHLFRRTPMDGADWLLQMEEARQVFETGLARWRKDFDQLMEAWHESKDSAQANSLRYQLNTLYSLTVIEAFSTERFLPRYGFPVGVHKLKVIEKDEKGRIRELSQYRLERPGLLALREYVPGSQLLVGGKLVTSRGLLKHWSGANLDNALGLRGGAAHCKNNHFFYWVGKQEENVCPQCDEKARGPVDRLLFPAHGFTTAAWDPPRRSSNIERIGQVSTGTIDFATKGKGSVERTDNFAGVPGVVAIYREDADILVYNRGDNGQGFAICTKCGYAESEKKERGAGLPNRFERHAPILGKAGSRCWEDAETPVLRHESLAAREPTDILMIDFSGFEGGRDTRELVTSLAIAFRLAGAKLLELDTRELGDLVVRVHGSWGIVLYDNVPGGAGHVLELMKRGEEWLEEVERILYINAEHDERCETACLDCILTFDGQSYFGDGQLRLSRRDALERVREMRWGSLGATETKPVGELESIDFVDPEVLHLLDAAPLQVEYGYEFIDERGRVEGAVELAWPESKICVALPYQTEGADAARRKGWMVFDPSQSEELKQQFMVGAS